MKFLLLHPAQPKFRSHDVVNFIADLIVEDLIVDKSDAMFLI